MEKERTNCPKSFPTRPFFDQIFVEQICKQTAIKISTSSIKNLINLIKVNENY